MKATKEVDIYLIRKRNVRTIDVVQYDTGVQLVFTVKDFTIPSGATAALYVQKPSGKFVLQEDGISIAGNTITVNLENQAITEHGKAPYQVSLKSGSDVITTFTGLMMVEKSLKDAGATESKTVIRAFDEAVSDHVSEFQTKAEQIVQACIATIPDDYTTMEAKVNEFANAVKGYLSGAVVFADDVSPVEHTPAVKVHGKNLFSTNELLVDKGSAYGGIPVPFYGVPGKTYTVSANFEQLGTATKVGISLTTSDGRWLKEVYGDKTSGKLVVSFTYPAFYAEGGFVSIGFFSNILPQAAEGAKCQYSNIQVEEGNAATDYEAYIDPATVTVKRCGKNLLKNTAVTQTIDGVTFTVNSDGSVKANGKAGANAPIRYALGEAVLAPGNYLVSGQSEYVGASFVMYSDQDGNNHQQHSGQDAELTLTKAAKINVYLVIIESATVSNIKVYPMIRLASATDEDYEQHKTQSTHIPATDGTVSGVTSLSPSMTILTDTEGVIVECEYNRDTNTVIDKLINAITAIGGTV